VVEEDRILLLRQRAGIRGNSLPGATLEEGETLAEALIREMREETGVNVEVRRPGSAGRDS
jgi:ADP-ribose pyrophosphatase YjhB (NUDIX family)